MSISTSRRRFLRKLALGGGAIATASLSVGGVSAFIGEERRRKFWKSVGLLPIPIQEHSQNSSLGHLLRDGHSFDFSGVQEEFVPTVIIGGGIAGLSAAWWLARAGRSDFELLELEAETGGNSSAGKNSVSAYPWGAHYLPVPNEESEYVRIFLHEIGVILGTDEKGRAILDETMICGDPNERLWIEGRFHEGIIPQAGITEADRREMKRFFARIHEFSGMRGSDGKPVFSIPVDAGSSERFSHPKVMGLDEISMAEWMDREGFRSKPLRWYANYGCRDDFGGTIETVSAWAGIHYHAGRRGNVANADPGAILTWPEGNAFLARKLRDRVKEKIRTQTLVLKIEEVPSSLSSPSKDASPKREVFVYAKTATGLRKIRARSVVVATPRFIGSRLLAGRDGIDLKKIDYAPWMVANLTLSEKPGTLSAKGESSKVFDHLAWDNVNYYSDSLGYVVATHQTQTIGKETVITLYWPLTDTTPRDARRAAEKVSLSEWKERVLAELERMHPEIRSITDRIDLRIWGHGMVRPSVGFLTGDTRAKMLRSLGNIHFAHSDLSGISIFEEAQYRGVLAAKKVLQTS